VSEPRDLLTRAADTVRERRPWLNADQVRRQGTRRRRTHQGMVALAAVVLLAAGGWLAPDLHRLAEPAAPNSPVLPAPKLTVSPNYGIQTTYFSPLGNNWTPSDPLTMSQDWTVTMTGAASPATVRITSIAGPGFTMAASGTRTLVSGSNVVPGTASVLCPKLQDPGPITIDLLVSSRSQSKMFTVTVPAAQTSGINSQLRANCGLAEGV
jgi:hypothetical protein